MYSCVDVGDCWCRSYHWHDSYSTTLIQSKSHQIDSLGHDRLCFGTGKMGKDWVVVGGDWRVESGCSLFTVYKEIGGIGCRQWVVINGDMCHKVRMQTINTFYW